MAIRMLLKRSVLTHFNRQMLVSSKTRKMVLILLSELQESWICLVGKNSVLLLLERSSRSLRFWSWMRRHLLLILSQSLRYRLLLKKLHNQALDLQFWLLHIAWLQLQVQITYSTFSHAVSLSLHLKVHLNTTRSGKSWLQSLMLKAKTTMRMANKRMKTMIVTKQLRESLSWKKALTTILCKKIH